MRHARPPAARRRAAEPQRPAAVMVLAPLIGACVWAALAYGIYAIF